MKPDRREAKGRAGAAVMDGEGPKAPSAVRTRPGVALAGSGAIACTDVLFSIRGASGLVQFERFLYPKAGEVLRFTGWRERKVTGRSRYVGRLSAICLDAKGLGPDPVGGQARWAERVRKQLEGACKEVLPLIEGQKQRNLKPAMGRTRRPRAGTHKTST